MSLPPLGPLLECDPEIILMAKNISENKEKLNWAFGNLTEFSTNLNKMSQNLKDMTNLTQLIDSSYKSVSTGYAGLKGAEDVAGIAEDLVCQDYICVGLGCIALASRLCVATCAFIPGSRSKNIQAYAIGSGTFSKTLRETCKKNKLFFCK